MKKSLRLLMVSGVMTFGLAVMPGIAFSMHKSSVHEAISAPVESAGEIATAYDYSFDGVVWAPVESLGEIVTAYDYSFDGVVSASLESPAVPFMGTVTTSGARY